MRWLLPVLLLGCGSVGAPAPDPPAPTAVEELHALDTRRPVPLRPMMAWHQKQSMMEHLVAIQQIADGLAREDWDAVARAADLIDSDSQTAQMCDHMGAGAEGFTEAGLAFHRRADAIAAAAQQRDGREALRATAHTLEACTSCHATYRQDVVDAKAWKDRTGGP